MVHTLATLLARPDTVDATRAALAALVEPTRAHSPGCVMQKTLSLLPSGSRK